MEVFVIAIAALGVVVVAYAYAAARQIMADREDTAESAESRTSLAFWFPGQERSRHPVHGDRQYDRRII